MPVFSLAEITVSDLMMSLKEKLGDHSFSIQWEGRDVGHLCVSFVAVRQVFIEISQSGPKLETKTTTLPALEPHYQCD